MGGVAHPSDPESNGGGEHSLPADSIVPSRSQVKGQTK